MERPRIVVLVGLPGSGKSTWLAERGLVALSSDAMRRLLTGDEGSQTVNGLVFRMLHVLAEARLEAGARVTYIDSTALTEKERAPWIEFARAHGCNAEALFFDVPLEECLRRNALRERKVPETALRRMAARLRPPRLEEGFARVSSSAGTTAR